MPIIGDVFGLTSIYEKQVENIDNTFLPRKFMIIIFKIVLLKVGIIIENIYLF